MRALEDDVDHGVERLRVQKAKAKQRKRELATAVQCATALRDSNDRLYTQLANLKHDLDQEKRDHFYTVELLHQARSGRLKAELDLSEAAGEDGGASARITANNYALRNKVDQLDRLNKELRAQLSESTEHLRDKDAAIGALKRELADKRAAADAHREAAEHIFFEAFGVLP